MCSNRCNNFITTNSFNNNFEDGATGLNTSDLANSYAMPINMRYGNSYVPVQVFRSVYSPATGLANGTMFPELVRPYMPNQSLAEMEYLRNYNERRCNN
jgi:hypothetical protein